MLVTDGEFSTFDIKTTLIDDKLKKICNVYTCNVFDNLDLIRKCITDDGKTLVLCDGGNKIKEFNAFTSYLKSGDYIMAHDYFSDGRFDDKSWSCEITNKDIMATVQSNHLTQKHTKIFDDYYWCCYNK